MADRNGSKGDEKLTVAITVYTPPGWREAVGAEADKIGIPMSEYIVRALAEKLRRKDLAAIPRKKPGRRRKELTAS